MAGALMRVARLPFAGWAVGQAFERWPDRLPVEVIYRDERVIAFHHPSLALETHILIVPRKRIATLLDLAEPARVVYLGNMLSAAHEVLRSLGLWFDYVTFLANGGPRQQVRQVHFHLLAGPPLATPLPDQTTFKTVLSTPGALIAEHPFPNWETHLIVRPQRQLSLTGALANPPVADLAALIGVLPELDRRYSLTRRGYSVCIQGRSEAERQRLTLHVIAGGRRSVG